MTLENFLLFISLEKNPHGVVLIFLRYTKSGHKVHAGYIELSSLFVH